MDHFIRTFTPLLLFLVAFPPCLRGGDPLPRQLDLAGVPATLIDDVIVPHPGELFALMDKLPGRADWRSRVRRDFTVQPTTNRTDLALIFGTLIADGFIAVQARDREGVKEAGHQILDLAEALSLQQAVLPHSQAILDACLRDDWAQVRVELDRTHKTVRDLMEQMRDEELARCVSVAGWIRGTEVLTGIISESYSPDKAEILNQPDLAAHFISQLQGMEDLTSSRTSMKGMLLGIQQVEALMANAGRETLPSDSVRQIHEIFAGIVEQIVPEPKD